jgi:hypothetical protein
MFFLQDNIMQYNKQDFANFPKLMKQLSEKLKEKKSILCVTGSKVAALSSCKLFSYYALPIIALRIVFQCFTEIIVKLPD